MAKTPQRTIERLIFENYVYGMRNYREESVAVSRADDFDWTPFRAALRDAILRLLVQNNGALEDENGTVRALLLSLLNLPDNQTGLEEVLQQMEEGGLIAREKNEDGQTTRITLAEELSDDHKKRLKWPHIRRELRRHHGERPKPPEPPKPSGPPAHLAAPYRPWRLFTAASSSLPYIGGAAVSKTSRDMCPGSCARTFACAVPQTRPTASVRHLVL